MKTRTAEELLAASRRRGQNGWKLVLVASRRTDMPAFHLEELRRGLGEQVFHPGPPRQPIYRLTFQPEEVHSVGLWSQDFSGWLGARADPGIDRYRFWYRFTILPDDPVCKPKAPPVDEQVRQLRDLARIDGADTIRLCVDPICDYQDPVTGKWRRNFDRARLAPLFEGAADAGIHTVTTSLLDDYSRVRRRASRFGVTFRFLHPEVPEELEEMVEMLAEFRSIAAEFGLRTATCCERWLLEPGAAGARCVDGAALSLLLGPGASTKPDRGQRRGSGCGCTGGAVDLGRYVNNGAMSHACGHDCPQCYAR